MEEDSQKQSSKFQYVAMLVIFVLLTVADGVLNILLFDVFGESYSQFLNQGTAAVYGILSFNPSKPPNASRAPLATSGVRRV